MHIFLYFIPLKSLKYRKIHVDLPEMHLALNVLLWADNTAFCGLSGVSLAHYHLLNYSSTPTAF